MNNLFRLEWSFGAHKKCAIGDDARTSIELWRRMDPSSRSCSIVLEDPCGDWLVASFRDSTRPESPCAELSTFFLNHGMECRRFSLD